MGERDQKVEMGRNVVSDIQDLGEEGTHYISYEMYEYEIYKLYDNEKNSIMVSVKIFWSTITQE